MKSKFTILCGKLVYNALLTKLLRQVLLKILNPVDSQLTLLGKLVTSLVTLVTSCYVSAAINYIELVDSQLPLLVQLAKVQ